MGSGKVLPLRALARFFLPGVDLAAGPAELPADEWKKVHNVLRMSSGDQLAVLPDDGSVWRCELQGHSVVPLEQAVPNTELSAELILALGLPKPDALETVVRMGSEMGVSEFWLFPTDRTVVRWEEKKLPEKLRRLNAIAREACEVAFRTRLPKIEFLASLSEALSKAPSAVVLSESDQVFEKFEEGRVLVIGPEGGWSPREATLIGERAQTLGPRVMRVDTAAACALARATR